MLKKQNSQGFSLIELSLLLLVFGALSVVVVQNLDSGTENNKNTAIYKQMKNIRSAILAYQKSVGYYPCPANPYLSATSQYYAIGQRYTNGNCVAENATEASATCAANASPNNVLCFKSITVDRVNVSSNYNIPKGDIIMGTVPCEDIGLPRDCMETPDGQKIAYATSSHLSRINPCISYVSSTGRSVVSGVYKFKLLKSYSPASSVVVNYSSSSGANQLISSSTNLPDFVLLYSGTDGVGGWTKAGTRITAKSASSGGYENDNIYQQINHNLNTASRQVDEYFLVPAKPLDTPDASLVAANTKIVFGDIIVFGKASETDLPKKICLNCRSCNVGWLNEIERLDTFTSCASSSPSATTVCN